MGVDITGKFGTPDAAEQGSISAQDSAVVFVFSGASAGVSISGIWSGTLVFEGTINQSQWFSISALRMSDFQIVTSTTTNGYFVVPCAEYAATRVRFSNYDSGIAAIYIFGGSAMQLLFARQPIAANFNAQVVGNVSAGSADIDNPVKIGGVFNSSLPIYSTGQRGDIQIDQYGRIRISADSGAGNTTSYTLRTVTNQGMPSNINNAWPILITDGNDLTTVTSYGELSTRDVADYSAVYGEITVGTVAVEGKIGATALGNRKYIIVEPLHQGIYLGFSNNVSINNGFLLFKHQLLVLPVGNGISVWFVATTNNCAIRLGELA